MDVLFIGIVILLIVYSTFINCKFGHQTFWRFNLLGYFNSVIKGLLKNIKPFNSNDKNFKCQDSLLSNLNVDIIHSILEFLNGIETLNFGTTSKLFYSVSNDDRVWKIKQYLTFVNEFNLLHFSCNKKYYFSQLSLYPMFLMKKLMDSAKNDSNIVKYIVINRCIYEISSFIHNHPGGPHILLENIGTDATVKFNLASHSATAELLKLDYLIWSPIRKWSMNRN